MRTKTSILLCRAGFRHVETTGSVSSGSPLPWNTKI